MALVKYGGGILEIRGSIGGQVHSKNRYGNYIRQRTIPVNPNSTRQQAVRADLAFLVEQWSAILTVAQRDAWAVYAAAITMTNKLGESIKLTGFNHFVRSNVSILNNALTYVPDGPVILSLPGSDPDFAVAFSEATQEISVTFDEEAAWVDQDLGFMSIHQGMPQLATRNFFGGPFRRIGLIAGDAITPPTSPQVISVSFPIAEGMKDWAFGRISTEDGRLSEIFRHDAIVAA